MTARPRAASTTATRTSRLSTVPFMIFQAVGEFIAAKSTTDSLEIQTRQAAWLGSTDVSVNSAVAIDVEGDRFGVYVGQSGIITRLNGSGAVMKEGITRLPGGGSVSRSETSDGPVYSVTWRDGSRAIVSPVASWGVALNVNLAASRRGHVAGLLGNFDGDSRNDLVTRAGQPIKNTPSFHDLYQAFGDSWRIRQPESLFDYAPGQSTATFTDRRLPARPVSAASLPNGQAAMAICRSLGITTPWILQACALDVAATGQAAFADSARLAQNLAAPACPGLSYAVSTPAAMRNGTESCHRFSASAGDVAELLVNGDGLTADMDVISPAGKSICGDVVTGGFDCTIPATGTYTILVRDHDHHFTGTYTLWAQRLNDPIGCAPLSYAVSTPAAMRNGTESCHRFSASAGDVAELLVNGDGLTADMDVISPAGKSICGDVVTGGFDCTIPATGTYTILVRDHDHHFTGTYTLTVSKKAS